MSTNTNLSRALKKIPSRFELIEIAAERAREIQEYESRLAKAENKLRNTSTLVIAQAKAKAGKSTTRETKVESDLEDLKSHPIHMYVERNGDKPTVVALREIQEGFVNRDFLNRERAISHQQSSKSSFDEIEQKIFEEVESLGLLDSFIAEEVEENADTEEAFIIDFEDEENLDF